MFFVRDPTKFQDFIHSQERNAHTGLRSNNAQWDFWSLSPESLRWGASDQGMMFARFFRKSERIYSSGTHPESRRSVPSNYVGDRSWHRQSAGRCNSRQSSGPFRARELMADVCRAPTRPLRMAAAKAGRAEFLSLWAGQGVRMARRQGAGDLVTRLAAEADAAIERLAASRIAMR